MAQKVETNPFLGRRIRMMRDDMGMTQEQLSEKLGFAHRQTLQQIETDARKVTVDELTRLIELSGRPFRYFTDPFLWDGDGSFSYRTSPEADLDLVAFEETAGNWVMLWRWLQSVNSLDAAPVPDFRLRVQSSYEEAQYLAERLVRWLKLGEVPAQSLGPVLEAELHIPVLFVDMPAGVSGATCHYERGNAILVNRNDSPGRRNFDLAHEFFHVLTWERMPPERIDRDAPKRAQSKRCEQLADNFAGALLMPGETVRQRWTDALEKMNARTDRATFLQSEAEHFQVSAHALSWRLVALGILGKDEAIALIKESDGLDSPRAETQEMPPRFSKYFLEQLARALDLGEISVRRAATLLALEVDALAETYASHSLAVPFDM